MLAMRAMLSTCWNVAGMASMEATDAKGGIAPALPRLSCVPWLPVPGSGKHGKHGEHERLIVARVERSVTGGFGAATIPPGHGFWLLPTLRLLKDDRAGCAERIRTYR
jgi:hypothetical protein